MKKKTVEDFYEKKSRKKNNDKNMDDFYGENMLKNREKKIRIKFIKSHGKKT